MKTKTIFTLALLITLTTVTGCIKKEDAVAAADAAGTGGTTTTPKATLTAWRISNSAWSVRLDVNANLSGTPFMFVIKYADNSEVHCSATEMTGTESSGTFDITGNCTGPGTGSMADSAPTIFETTGVGSYTNNGSVLTICRVGTNSCLNYYP